MGTRCRKAFALLVLNLGLVISIPPLSADVSPSYVLDEEGRRIASPQAYLVERIIDGRADGGLPFNRPTGMFIDAKGALFVADTGNNRVVKMDPSGLVLATFREAGGNKLSAPQGVFVNARGEVYIADSGNGRIVKLGPDGMLIREYFRPDSPFLTDLYFQPSEVVVDRREFMYVINGSGDYRGILTIDREGKFRGFFAPNRLAFDIRRLLARFIASKEQRERLKNELPPGNVSLGIDDQGFLYTVTPGAGGNQVKKLNSLGINVSSQKFYGEKRDENGQPSIPHFSAVGADSGGNIYAFDATLGKIYVYDQAGNLLFVFGGRGDQRGQFNIVSSIKIDGEGKVYVLDGIASRIQVFAPTMFAGIVLRANTLYYEGRYQQAEQPWRDVLKYDGNYLLAHTGLGKTFLKQDRAADALDEFRNADDRAGYSRAWGELRRAYTRERFGLVILWILVGTAVVYAAMRLSRQVLADSRRSGGVWRRTLRQAAGIISRPHEAFLSIKEEGSLLSLIPLLGLYYVVGNLRLELTSFHFAATDPRSMSLILQATRLFLPWISWCVVVYAISTISDGKGFFKDVLLASGFCLVPSILFSLPLALLSRILTLDEQWFYSLLDYSVSAWVLLLFFSQVRTIQDFVTRKALRVSVLSVLGIGIVWAGAALVYGLSDQVVLFGQEVVTELVLHAR